METSSRHVLQTSEGITLEFFIHPETLHMRVVWNPAPPTTREKLERVMREYLPWRDSIVSEAALKAGKRVMILTPCKGKIQHAVFGPPEGAIV